MNRASAMGVLLGLPEGVTRAKCLQSAIGLRSFFGSSHGWLERLALGVEALQGLGRGSSRLADRRSWRRTKRATDSAK